MKKRFSEEQIIGFLREAEFRDLRAKAATNTETASGSLRDAQR